MRKAMKAFVRPIKEIADAIQRQDNKWLTTLPGIGAGDGGADRRHVAPQGDQVRPDGVAEPNGGADSAAPSGVDGQVLEDAYQALMSVGHSPQEARDRLDKALAGGKKYKSVEEILMAIYAAKVIHGPATDCHQRR